MKALIIEDEKAAVRNLMALLGEVDPDIEVIDVLDSITDSVEWFQLRPMPELIFLDIHLADGSAFEIFGHVDISCPVIFTTAYDEYALKAFKVNSVDYLLKPIDADDIRKALDKLSRLQSTAVEKEAIDYSAVMQALIPMKGDKLLPVSVDMILFFYIADGNVKAVMTDGKEYLFTQTLDELADSLDPALFFRINRQYLISRKAVQDIDLWFNGRLAINLIVPTLDRILVSKARVPDFKTWFTS